MLFTELLTRNLRYARAAAGLDQTEVRDLMNELGFTSWQRSTVSMVERGKRKLSVEELTGLALVYDVAPARLFRPDDGELPVTLPGGFTFRAVRLMMNDGSVEWKDGKPVAVPTKARIFPAGRAAELPDWMFLDAGGKP
ncbi:MAG: helix-turn-helix transcriptional regulator [Actinobacteria bacterium]|nr:helix-turn-helix transcriptional regulator [Actinomycetota bacterium]